MIINDKGFVIYHIPKTGGGSVRKFFAECEGNRADLVRDQHETPFGLRARLPALHPGLMEFVFVRNPWDRIESGYRHVKRYHKIVREHYPHFHKFVEDMNEKGSLAQGYFENSQVFLEQIVFADSISERGMIFNMRDLEKHCRVIAAAYEIAPPEEFPHHHKGTEEPCLWTPHALKVFDKLYGPDIERFGKDGFRGAIL